MATSNPVINQALAAWLAQAQASPGNTINQWQTSPLQAGNNPTRILPLLQQAGLDTTGITSQNVPRGDAYRGGDNPLQAAWNADDYSAFDGYSFREARGPDYNLISQLVDLSGNPVAEEITQQNESMHHGDWANVAALIAAAVTAGAGGAAGLGGALSGGALSGTSAAALGGAAAGGFTGAVSSGGTLDGTLKGAALGGLGAGLSSAASQYFNPGGPGIDSAATAGDYTNQMDLASDAFSRGVDPAAFSGGYVNQMDAASDAFSNGDSITDAATGQPVNQFTTNGNTTSAANPAGISNTGTANNTSALADASDLNYRNGSDISSDNSIPGRTGTQNLSLPTNTPNPGDPNFMGPITRSLVGAGATLAAGQLNNPGDPPDPNAGGSGSGNSASRDAIITRLENQLWGNDAASGPDFSGVNPLITNVGDPDSYYQLAADASYNRAKTYLDPEVANRQQALEARLAEQGFVPGTPGYTRAMQTFQDTTNRAYSDARDASIQQGVNAGQNTFNNSIANANLNNGANNTAFQQAVTRRAIPFNEYSTLRTGASTDATNNYNAQLGQYNARVAGTNATNQAIGTLAGAAAQYFVPSDARLKSDIVPLGQTPGGANLYAYTIFGRREVGVIAQELLLSQPWAVQTDHPSGYLHVNYAEVK